MRSKKLGEITFEEFIKNHVRVAPEGKNIEMTPIQYAFMDWLEKIKKKGLKPFYLNRKGRICLQKITFHLK